MTSRVCRVLSALALFVGATSLLPGGARAEAAQSGSPAGQIGINQVVPQIPDFTDLKKTMTLSGFLRNTGAATLRNAYVEIRRTQVRNRSEMGSATAQSLYTDDYVSHSQQLLPPNIAPNTQAPWTVTLSERDLFGGSNEPTPGVYAFDVLLIDGNDNFLSGQRTFLEWKPLGQTNTKKARIALMWPVVGQPGLTGQKKADNSGLPILPDQSAAQQFAQGSRLSRILTDPSASGLTVNWLLDPDVLYTASELSRGYFYPDPQNGGKLTGAQSTETDAANLWYSQASGLASSSPNCWNLLYGDPDLNTLSRSDAGKALLKAATDLHPPALTGCRQTGPTVAWPSDGQTDATTLSGIASTKVSNLVTLVGSNQVSVWPSAHASLPNSPNTVVYDNYLSALFAAPTKGSQPSLSNAGVLAGQEWLAQTALADSDNTGRVLVVTPPRDFDPPQELLDAIKAITKVVPATSQWFGLDSLSQVLSAPVTAQHASALTKITTPNLSETVVDQASDSQRLYTALHAIMVDHGGDPAVPFRPVSTSWRNQGGAAAYSKVVYDTAVSDHSLVSFGTQTPPLTMSGKSGTVPVTVKNQTNTAIRVFLRTSTSNTVDLKVDPTQGAHDVEAGQSATIRIPVQGRGNGEQVKLYASLYTCPDASDCAYYPSGLLTNVDHSGGQTQVTVKVSRIGIIALALIIGSGILLVLLIGLRVYRAKRAHHAPAQDTMAS